MEFDQALQLIELLIILIAMILIHRSVPSAQLQKLFDALERNARQTATPVDDQVVGFGKLLATLLTGQMGTPQPAAAGPVTTTGAAIVVTNEPAAPSSQTETPSAG